MGRRAGIIGSAPLLLALALVIDGAGPAGAASHVTQSLTATTNAPGAKGRAKLALKTASKGRFRVMARGLAKGATFDLVVGGVKVGTLTTNRGGAGKAKLATSPKRSEGLLGVDPRGQTIEIRDADGNDDLVGDMPDQDSTSGAFACCLPDDGGTECDTKTPDECSSKGGTSMDGVSSCIPNPCGAPPHGGEGNVVCCFPGSATGAFVDDDAEAECDDVSTADCAAAGGTVVTATSCDPNPCAAVPPAQVVVCCVPHDGESECEIVTPDRCTAQSGTASSATSCESDPCGGQSSDGEQSGDSGDSTSSRGDGGSAG